MPLIDQKILEDAKGLMRDKFKTMIEYYIEDVANYITDINSGFVDCDYKKIVTAAHTIKSSSRQIGAIDLSDLGKDLESFGRSEWREEIEKALPKLKNLFNQTKEALAAS